VLKFQQAGVTHVTQAYAYGDFANFTNVAQEQGFHPKYGLPDDSITVAQEGGTGEKPNAQNVAGAIVITPSAGARSEPPV
jgi:hypothetical protein